MIKCRDNTFQKLLKVNKLSRLQNQLEFSRVREKDLFRGTLTEFRTLREDEIAIRDQLPDRYFDITYQRELENLGFVWDSHLLLRHVVFDKFASTTEGSMLREFPSPTMFAIGIAFEHSIFRMYILRYVICWLK